MSQRVILAVQVMLVAVGLGLFAGGPIGREVAASGLLSSAPAGEGAGVYAGSAEAFRAVGALLMGAGLFFLSHRHKSVR